KPLVCKFWTSVLKVMSIIKYILIVLIPVSLFGQTVHVDEDRVVYKDKIKMTHTAKDDLFERARTAMDRVKWNKQSIVVENRGEGLITARGTMRLVTPYHTIRTVEYLFEIKVSDGDYGYRIDSISLEEKERGGKTLRFSSKELLKAAEETGKPSIVAEKILNEIDMNFQKLLALIQADMKLAGSKDVSVAND
ncbi:MAG TPA: DUF4468 domain-containing protein, partial [Chitinophagaceae bacterium]|nr:DUF4468 domain-containing protein [Chitinophagaceae bacterium]